MKKNKSNGNIVILIIIYFIGFIFISAAYSFFSEKLDLVGTTGFSSDVFKEYNYDYILQSKWQRENYYYYQYAINITYTGNENVDSWQLNLRVPMTTEVHGCYNASNCVLSDTILKITNAHWNGNVSNKTIATPSIIIKTTVSDYELDIISINFYSNGIIVNPSTPGEGSEDQVEPDDSNPPTDSDNNLISDIYANLSNKEYWGNTTAFELEIVNNSSTNLVNWELKYKVPEGTKVNVCWGANYIITENILILSGLNWSQNVESGDINKNVGFHLTSLEKAPITLELISFVGVNDNHEEVVIKS